MPKADYDLYTKIELSKADKEVSSKLRASRRAFNGAPPIIPHPVENTTDAACYACHSGGVQLAGMKASVIRPAWNPLTLGGPIAPSVTCRRQRSTRCPIRMGSRCCKRCPVEGAITVTDGKPTVNEDTSPSPSYRIQLRKLLAHSELSATDWINVGLDRLTFSTVTKND